MVSKEAKHWEFIHGELLQKNSLFLHPRNSTVGHQCGQQKEMRAAQHRFNYFGFSWGAFFEWLCLHILVQVLWRNSETRVNRAFSRSERRHKGVPQPLYNWRMCVKNSPDNRRVVYRINKTTNNTRLTANLPLAKLCMGKIYDSGAAVCNLTSRKPFAKRMGLGVRRRGDFGSILERINPLWHGVRWNMHGSFCEFLRVLYFSGALARCNAWASPLLCAAAR